MTMRCATCGNEEPEGARFCGNCGAPFVAAEPEPVHAAGAHPTIVRCSSCGNEEPQGARFCGTCGRSLTGQADAPLARTRRPWIAAATIVVLLVAGGAVAALLVRSEGDSAGEATPTARPVEQDTAEIVPPAPTPTPAPAQSNAPGIAKPKPKPKPVPTRAVRRSVDLVPLLVGIRPDDPPGEGRCFGAYTTRATLTVSGVAHRSGFIQCGDDANGNPSRTTGVYRFAGPTFPAGARLVRVTGQVAIDESSAPSRRGSSVTWTAVYAGRPICSRTVVWSGSRPSPGRLDCRVPQSLSADGFDLRRLRIRQVASLASSGSVWAGLLHPTVVVEVPA